MISDIVLIVPATKKKKKKRIELQTLTIISDINYKSFRSARVLLPFLNLMFQQKWAILVVLSSVKSLYTALAFTYFVDPPKYKVSKSTYQP